MESSVLPVLTAHARNLSELQDPFNRTLNYLRLSITERCNLRCTYCMPAEGVPLKKGDHLLSYEEMNRLLAIFTGLGVKKVRITGGEPFVRRDAIHFIQMVNDNPRLESINITTNAILIEAFLAQLKKLKLGSLNISLDSLKREIFYKITRRDEFHIVYENLLRAIDMGLPVKINMVVMAGVNEEEIVPFAALTESLPVEIRFIEQMPFNGGAFDENIYSAKRIRSKLEQTFTLREQIVPLTSTARVFKIDGFKGQLGIIAGFSRTFCGACNRLRLTADGLLKTCLYDRVAANLKDAVRSAASDEQIREIIIKAVSHRAKDGFESQSRSNGTGNLSMAQIGG